MINTKCIKVFAISILAFFIFTQSKSEVKVAFVEMDKIIRESLS
jgi:Skp family chaperone for outer membrane proteins